MSEIKTSAGADLNHTTFHNLVKGETSEVRELVLTNPFTYTLKDVRVFVQLTTGLFDEANIPASLKTLEQGREVMNEQWVEVRRKTVGGAFIPVGGPYGFTIPDPAIEEGSNFLAVPDMAPGAEETIEYRITVPVDAETERTASVRFGYSWSNNIPEELV